jgi:hypothetical protein
MWAKIFNHPQIQNNETLRECILSHVNFEHAYAAVMESGRYSNDEKTAFTEAVRAGFRNCVKTFSTEHEHRTDEMEFGTSLIR